MTGWELVQTKRAMTLLVHFLFSEVLHHLFFDCCFERSNQLCLWYRNTEPGAWNWFGHTYNTTNCGDGTFCMNSGNETCCLNREGIKEITYHNNATIPTNAQAWTAYYENAGYSLPSTTIDPLTSTFPTLKSDTTLPVQSQPLNYATPSTSQQPSLINIVEPTHTSATATAMSSREKAIIGTASALGALLILGAVGSLYLFRRSRFKRSGKPGLKDRLEAVTIEDTGLTGHRMVGEMDATWDRSLDEAHLGGLNELMGRDNMALRAELTGQNGREVKAELPA